MKFTKRKNARGFTVVDFQDSYGEDCNIQISSAVTPHIWLGIFSQKVRIMCKDAKAIGLECGETGWCDYPIPDAAFIPTRMHLTKKQSFRLALKLLKFAFFGQI